jgi:hypothetical protein
MSIFSRLRKRDSDDATAPNAKAPAAPPSAKTTTPSDAKAPDAKTADPKTAEKSADPKAAPREAAKTAAPPREEPKASASKVAAPGMTRAYQAVKPEAIPGARHAVPVSTTPGSAGGSAKPPAGARGAARTDDDARGAVAANGAGAKATNAANGTLGANGVQIPHASPNRRGAGERPPAANGAGRGHEDSAPREALETPGSIDQAFEALFPPDADEPARREGTSTASDRKAVMATFEELAVGHTAPIRSFMLEVRWGEAQTSWIELARPALKSLRAMAGQMEHATLPAAIDAFDAALAELLRPGAPPTVAAAARDGLLAAYAPLITAMPKAFELDGERDRREPVIVRALLEQVPGLDQLMAERMIAAGLNRLDALYQAKADEIAVVAEVPNEVASATAELVQAFRRTTPAALAAPDGAAAAADLRALVGELGADHRAFEEASRGWSAADRDAKKRTRRKRDVDFARVTIALARLGEVDFALYLQKVPFQRRLEELEGLVGRLTASVAPGRAAEPGAPMYDEIEIEKRMDSGAHPAP